MGTSLSCHSEDVRDRGTLCVHSEQFTLSPRKKQSTLGLLQTVSLLPLQRRNVVLIRTRQLTTYQGVLTNLMDKLIKNAFFYYKVCTRILVWNNSRMTLWPSWSLCSGEVNGYLDVTLPTMVVPAGSYSIASRSVAWLYFELNLFLVGLPLFSKELCSYRVL